MLGGRLQFGSRCVANCCGVATANEWIFDTSHHGESMSLDGLEAVWPRGAVAIWVWPLDLVDSVGRPIYNQITKRRFGRQRVVHDSQLVLRRCR